MTKAWCVWCQTGSVPKTGYLWIHEKCANEIMDRSSDIKTIREILEGKHPRCAENPGDRIAVVLKMVSDMEAFDQKWKNAMALLKQPFTGYDPFQTVERQNKVVRVSCSCGEVSLVKSEKKKPISHCPHCGRTLLAHQMCVPTELIKEGYWWVSYKGAPEQFMEVKVEDGKTYLRALTSTLWKMIDENYYLMDRINKSEHYCSDCVHVSRPSGGTCGTMLRVLHEKLGDRPMIPVHAVPIMVELEATCKRYKKRVT
jgi:hypothetical protein